MHIAILFSDDSTKVMPIATLVVGCDSNGKCFAKNVGDFGEEIPIREYVRISEILETLSS